jgi:hypothetical protein
MTLYKVIAEQKITKKIIVVVEANSDEEAMEKVRNKEIISAEKTLDTEIDGFIPIEIKKY